MRGKFLYPLAVVLALGAGGMAMAAGSGNEMASGTVKAIDQTAMTVTLEDGTVFAWTGQAAADLTAAVKALKVGDKVNITYMAQGDSRTIKTIAPAS